LGSELENPRQRCCVAGDKETLKLDQTRQTQVTFAREAASKGDNTGCSSYTNDSWSAWKKQIPLINWR
jgi:hypothetical protein